MEVRVESLIEGLMVYWTEVENASRYYVHLLVGDKHPKEVFDYNLSKITIKYGNETYQELKVIECDRHTKTTSFYGLAYICRTLPTLSTSGIDRGLNYYIYVEAEDKEGNLIETSKKILGNILLFNNGYYIR